MGQATMADRCDRALDASDDAFEAMRGLVHLHLVAQPCDLRLELADASPADPLVVTRKRAVDSESRDTECRGGGGHGAMLLDSLDDLPLTGRGILLRHEAGPLGGDQANPST